MRYCRSKSHRVGSYIFPTICLAIVFWCILVCWEDPQKQYAGMWLGIAAFMLIPCVFLGLYIIWENRKYQLSQDGITVAYFEKYPKTFSWNDISEVAVCKVHYDPKGGWETVIRVAVWTEYGGPGNGDGD